MKLFYPTEDGGFIEGNFIYLLRGEISRLHAYILLNTLINSFHPAGTNSQILSRTTNYLEALSKGLFRGEPIPQKCDSDSERFLQKSGFGQTPYNSFKGIGAAL